MTANLRARRTLQKPAGAEGSCMAHPHNPCSPQEACGQTRSLTGLCPASPLIWVTLWNISSCYSPCLAPRAALLSSLSSLCPQPLTLEGSPQPQACYEPQMCYKHCLTAPSSPGNGRVWSQSHFKAPSQCIMFPVCFFLSSHFFSAPLPCSVFCVKAPHTPFPVCLAMWLLVQLLSA